MIEIVQSVTSALDGRAVINHGPIFISSDRDVADSYGGALFVNRRFVVCNMFITNNRPYFTLGRNGAAFSKLRGPGEMDADVLPIRAARHRERDLSSLSSINEKESGRPLIWPASAWPSAGWMNPRPTRTLLSRGNNVRLLKEKQKTLFSATIYKCISVRGSCRPLLWQLRPFSLLSTSSQFQRGQSPFIVHCWRLCRAVCAPTSSAAHIFQTRATGVFRVPWPIFTGCRSETLKKILLT
jgi:hypothetical protein